jgi:UDP-N-acetylmuramoyl-tripeptide--D-alanyl-D-alanine ligase
MTVAIENFIQIQGLNKIMILGDMFELGSKKRASANCRLLLKVKSVQCFFIGTMFYSSRVSNPQFQFYESFDSFSLSRGLE